MEATIEREATYSPAGFGKAFAEQFRLLWTSRRPLLVLVGLLGLLTLAGEPWSQGPIARLFKAWPIWAVLVGPFWGFAVWHNEGPANRLYFWSQPVSRTAHAMGRVAAGAAWLLVLSGALILAGTLFAAFEGHLGQFAALNVTAWVSFFTGPLLGYLVISALTVWSDYPIRWFLGVLFGVPITLTLLDEWLRLEAFIKWILTPLSDETWGLGVSIVGPIAVAMQRLHDAIEDTPTSGGLSAGFDLDTWWVAVALWVLFWTTVVFLLARPHPDTFPRWRRAG